MAEWFAHTFPNVVYLGWTGETGWWTAIVQTLYMGPALVGGEEVLHAEELRELGVHAEEGLAPGVGVVGAEHGRLHLVAHGVDAGVGEHVQEDVGIVELEGVEPGGADALQALADGEERELLDDLDLVHLQGDGVMLVKLDLRHGVGTPVCID